MPQTRFVLRKALALGLLALVVYRWRRRTTLTGSALLAAVLAAACIGNMYHHILASPDLVIRFDLAGLWATWGPRTVYCLLLALGIWVSMLRQKKLRASGLQPTRLGRLRKIAATTKPHANAAEESHDSEEGSP